MTPATAIYRAIYGLCAEIVDTYDHIPNAQAKYPFAVLTDQSQQDMANNDLLGRYELTLRLYSTVRQREQLDDITSELRDRLIFLDQAHQYSLAFDGFHLRELQENQEGQPLIHRILTINFNYNK